MKRFHPALFLTVVRMMEKMIRSDGSDLFGEDVRTVAQAFDEMPKDCIDAGLDASKITADKVVKLLSKPDVPREALNALFV